VIANCSLIPANINKASVKPNAVDT
jgi:hypothetical protein